MFIFILIKEPFGILKPTSWILLPFIKILFIVILNGIVFVGIDSFS